MRAAGDRSRRARRLGLAAGAALACAGLAACAPRAGIEVPAGPETPDASAVAAFDRASAPCRDADTATAEVAVSGRLGGDRVRGRLLVGLDRRGRLRIEALAPFGEPIFVLAGDGGRVTLLLPRQGRVLRDAPAADVLDALAGLRLDPPDLRALLAGCVADRPAGEGATVGAFFAVRLGDRARAFLPRAISPPRVVSGEVEAPGAALRVGYAEFGADGRPRVVRLARSAGPGAVDLQLRIPALETGAPLGPEAARVRVPSDAVPITIDELRRSSPLAARQPPASR